MATSNRMEQDSRSESGTTFLSEKNCQVFDTAVSALFSGDSVSSNDFSGRLVADTYHPEIIWIDKEEQDGNNSDLLFENFLEPSCRFFESTWTGEHFRGEHIFRDDYQYRVYFTRGCFNLNEMFYYAYIRKREKGYGGGWWPIPQREESIRKARKNFISQNALLSYIHEISDFYERNNYFPVFLLADELVIYGREISSFLRTLESALSELNSKKSRETYSDWALRGKLIASLRLRACVQGERPLLEDRFCAGIQPQETRDRAGYRAYIQEASSAITLSNDVENTSYAPYFRMTVGNYNILRRHLAADGWHNRTWKYLRLKAEIWQKPVPSPDGQPKVEWTFRVHPDLNERGEEGDTVRVVALPLFERLSWDSIKSITAELLPLFQEFDKALSLKSNDASKPKEGGIFYHLMSLMKCPCNLIRRVQLQWITFLLAAYSFLREIKAAETEETGSLFRLSGLRDNLETFVTDIKEKNHDLDKMAQNFGMLKDTYPALCLLCGEEGADFRNRIGERLLVALERELTTAHTESYRFPIKTCQSMDSCLRRAEDIFYEVGMRDEKLLSNVQKNGLTYGSEVCSDSRVSMNEYYDRLNDSSLSEGFNREDSIGALLMLMDQGLVSMVMGDTVQGEAVSVFLRAGELSTFVIVRRLYRFVPALIELENRCRRLGYQVERQLIRFGKYLDEREPGQHLEKQFEGLEKALKECNQRLRDWDINLLDHLDLPRIDRENPENSVRATQEWCGAAWEPEVLSCASWMEYRQYEQGRQEYYRRLACEFSLT